MKQNIRPMWGWIIQLAAQWPMTYGVAANEITVANLDQLRQSLRMAAPGSRIVLAGGMYTSDSERGVYAEINGRADAPIQIAAADPDNPPIFEGGGVPLHFYKSSHFIVDGLVVRGGLVNNIQIDFSSHFVLRNSKSLDIAGSGNHDGVKIVGSTDFLLDNMTISRWGKEGSAVDMVACARGLIANSMFTYPGLTGSTANGIQPKGGTHSMGFYRNRFINASHRALQFGGSTGKQFFHLKNFEQGYEGFNMVAMGNVFQGGAAAIAYVSCTRCVAEFNTIVSPDKWIFRVLQEGGSRPTADNVFSRNLIVGASDFNHGGNVDIASFVCRDNFWVGSVGNLPGQRSGDVSGSVTMDDNFTPPAASAASAYGAAAPGMKQQWLRHTEMFSWAWQQAEQSETAK